MVFIAGDLDGVTIWDWRNLAVERLGASEFAIRKVAVDASGTLLATAGSDRVVRIWDARSRTEIPGSVETAGKVDQMWLSAGGDKVIIHAGHWLHSLAVYPSGLATQNTRLLENAPVAVQPLRDASAAHLLLAAPGRPVVIEQPLDRPLAGAAVGDPAELRALWRSRLSLTISPDGEVLSPE
jgi:WD40 repeat protein